MVPESSSGLAREGWPLVGRDAVVARLVSAARRGLRGAPGVGGVVVAGAAGTGKTRVALEVASQVGAVTGCDVARVIATASGATIPLGALAPLLPSDGAPEEVGADALLLAADAIATGAPRLLVVDDLHQLDAASATVVLQLVTGRRLFLVGTLRTGEPAPDAVTALWKDDLVDRVDLGALDRPSVAGVLGAVLGGEVDGATAHELWSASAGNPLFLRELVVGAVDSGAVRRDQGIWRLVGQLPTTDRLVQLIADRLDGLAPEARRLLEVLAVGEPLGPHLLAPEGDTTVLDDLERRGVVTVTVDGHRELVRFDHPLFGDVIRAELPVLRARQINRSLADAVTALGARRRTDVLQVAVWRLDGGGRVDPALMLEAARLAHFRHEPPLAERLARAAHDASGDAASGLLLGEVLGRLGRVAEADAVYAAVADAAPSVLERTLASASRASNLFWGLGRYPEAVAVLTAVEEEVDGEVRDEILGMHATITMLAGRPTEALALAEALLLRASGRALVNASIAAATALALAGRADRAREVALRAHGVHLGLGDQQLLARPWIHEVSRGFAAIEGGPLSDADDLAERGYAAALDGGEPAAQAWFALIRARAALLRGRPTTAGRWFTESAARFADIGEHGPRRWAVAGRALASALLDDPASVRAALAEADAIDTPMEMMEGEVRRARAWARAADGDRAGARALLESAVADALDRGADALAGIAGWELARLGDRGAAAAALSPLLGREGPLGLRAAHAVAAARRDAGELDRISAELEAFGFELEAAEAAAEAARAWARVGDARRATARDRRVEALRAACEGAFTPLLAVGAGGDRLTDRQREVALLAARGLTSKAVAEQLGLSRRTVDNNLQQVFVKLGIRRRTELADALGLEP